MSREKIEEKEIAVEGNKFLKWLDNYWYHYKWPTIVVAFFVVVVLVCVIQSATTERKDIIITYAGPAELEADDTAAIQSILSDNLPEGFGNKGNAGKAGLVRYIIYSKEQIKDYEDKQIQVDTVFNSQEYEALNSQYKTGRGSIYLLDRWLYDEIVKTSEQVRRLKPLAEIFGETPECAVDAYGIRLGDTEIYKSNPELSVLPADTMVCLHEEIMGQKDYEKEVEAFRQIAKPAQSAEN